MTNVKIKVTIVVCLIISSILGGYSIAKLTIEPEYIHINTTETITEIVEVQGEIIEVEVEVEKVVVFTEYVDRLVEVHTESTREIIDWKNVDELKTFLENDDSDKVIVLKANSDGVILLNNQCEDIALRLIDRAQVAGRRLFFVPLHREEYAKWYDTTIEEGHYHAVAGAIVGDNDFYYIEPTTDKYWLALYLD